MLDFSLNTFEKRKGGDALVIPIWENGKKATSVKLPKGSLTPVETGDFTGKVGEVQIHYDKSLQDKRIILLGLGEKKEATVEILRRAYGELQKVCSKKKFLSLHILIPTINHAARGVAEGLLSANYSFDLYLKKSSRVLLKKIIFLNATKDDHKLAKDAALTYAGVNFSRDLINTNADEMHPQELVKQAKALGKMFPAVKVSSLDKKQIEKHKLGLILAVNKGSFYDPALIMVNYKGNPRSKEHTIIVGKGITYDTGGINLKKSVGGSLEIMKKDMSGAAIVLGVIHALAGVKAKCNVTAVVPTAENCIGERSYKPGDVYISYSGKSVEIGNTDAEGRLVLADALAYSVKNLKPTKIIDIATLTGSIFIALGDQASGLFSNDDSLSKELTAAGERTYERVWRLPLFEEYRAQLNSDIADMNNVGGPAGGSIVAAKFLQEFVGEIPWAHLDIAGTSWRKEAKYHHPKFATAVGVRLLVDYLTYEGKK